MPILHRTPVIVASIVVLLAACGGGGGGDSSGGGGGSGSSGGGDISGIVYVKASDTAQGDRFGGTLGGTNTPLLNELNFGGQSAVLSDDGSTLVVGSWFHDGARGQVYVFVKDGGGDWIQQSTFQAPNAGPTDRFGAALALSADGDTLAVGAPTEDSSTATLPGDDNFTNAGAAYVYTRSAGTWSLQQYIKASDRAGGDVFGVSVALSEDGDTLAVGAMGKDTVSGDEGVAYVFTRSLGNWTERDRVESDSPETNDLFGYRVALSADGTTLAVGAESDGNNERPIGAGAVFAFTEGPANDWQFDQEIVQPNPVAGSRFGSAVALSDDGDTLAAGAHNEDGRGEVHVFVRSSGAYSIQDSLVASNADPGDRFGAALALSGAGDLLVVSAPREDSNATGVDGNADNDDKSNSGAAYQFQLQGSTWTEMDYIKASNTDPNDFFGGSITLSDDGTVLAVGAGGEASNATGINGNQDNNSLSQAGAVYIFE